MLIAKVRHNRRAVRVASGRGKLSVNAIMFPNPTAKVHNVLPPSKTDISEVLAFVFLGPTRPTNQEFQRTPMLVRRNRVKHALDWLKLNHIDYEDLEISSENLDDLPDNGVLFGVDWRETQEGETTNIPKQLSVHDDSEPEGTESGQCTFVVHRLSGEEYGNVSINTSKAKALDHLANNGKTLGFGHAKIPESLYNNLQLYPQMLPWLFLYGLGSIGQPSHKRKFSGLSHKKHLLVYHDKRFQTDLYFPMVAFNEEQIKSGVSGSHLLANGSTSQMWLTD
ncbi:hypothetical protein B0H10DRAFT_1776214 [Mycena sp. CBHHK59/15]|nr:hypothetical protein B0H10DRAFT_1776214 [Mycena sp. CBHHK59/15]